MRVLLADDQASVRSALRLLLEQEGVEVVGEAADTVGVLVKASSKAADLILLDWELPGVPAGDLIPLLHFSQPGIQVVALSGRPEAQQAALAAGADAFVSKGDPPEHVLTVLKHLRSDGHVNNAEQPVAPTPDLN